MNASYLFALDLDQSVLSEGTPEEIFGDAAGMIEERYLSHWCESFWWRPVALVIVDGRLFNASPGENLDNLNESGKAFAWWQEKEDPWQEALNLAARCVAVDMELFGATSYTFIPSPARERIEAMAAEELREAILKEIPVRLAEAYTRLARGDVDENLVNLRREGLARQFEYFAAAQENPEETLGFFSPSRPGPYEHYRAISLTRGKAPNAILVVDIET